MTAQTTDDFFIGWAKRLPRTLRWPMLLVILLLPATMVVLAMALARGQDDPGTGDWGAQATLRGTLTALPYPLLRLPPDAAYPQGHTVMLSAFGKAQVKLTPALAGHAVEAGGQVVHRGSLEMLVVNDPAALRASDAALPPPAPPVQLGRWRIAGEICDGKCASGAMRPGTGLAHRACASFCLDGELPAMLVSSDPVAGSEFLLLAGPDGGPIPASLARLVGVLLQLDGTLERRGDMLVFRAEPSSIRLL